jgi:hypothetical protein
VTGNRWSRLGFAGFFVELGFFVEPGFFVGTARPLAPHRRFSYQCCICCLEAFVARMQLVLKAVSA